MLNQKQLVDQQFWLFGRDVAAEQGNRLIELGGERIATWRRGKAAAYRMPSLDEPASCVVLWGFGALLVVDGIARGYLQRSTGRFRVPDAVQALIDYEQACAESFFAWRYASDDEMNRLDPIIRWVIDHEYAVVESYGVAARRSDLSKWASLGKPTSSVGTIPSLWSRLASQRFGSDLLAPMRRDAAQEGSITRVASETRRVPSDEQLTPLNAYL